MKILIVIPCYNHENYCKKLISKIENLDILIIDDGSKNPFSLLNCGDNVSIHRNNINKGKGSCIKFAAQFAKNISKSHILVIDADLQHDPSKIGYFIKESNFDLVYGKRNFNSDMPILRRLSNTLTSMLISKVCRKKIYDTQCGFRLYDLNLFENLNSQENGYLFETEILLKKINKKSNINYIEIPTIYNKSNSNINNVKDTLRFIRLLINNYI